MTLMKAAEIFAKNNISIFSDRADSSLYLSYISTMINKMRKKLK